MPETEDGTQGLPQKPTPVRHPNDLWGRVRTGGSRLTARTCTGQRRDATGLLYYHAWYYDPTLGRFISPDSIVPGAGALTAAPHDAVAQQAWGQGGSGDELEQDGSALRSGAGAASAGRDPAPPKRAAIGPKNPQTLNRYAYALNNSVKYIDPTGHWTIEISLGSGLFALIGIRMNTTFAADLQGNVTLYVTPGFMLSTAAGYNIGPTISITNAPSVDDLRGWAVGIGAQSETIPLAIAAKGFLFNSEGNLYGGVTFGAPVTLSAEFTKMPFELHEFAEYSYKLTPTWNIVEWITHRAFAPSQMKVQRMNRNGGGA